MTQPTLFDPQSIPTAPACIPEPERARLSLQAQKILGRLKEGRATNYQLAVIALKYTSRLSDLRRAGYDVRIVERDTATGITVYELRDAA